MLEKYRPGAVAHLAKKVNIPGFRKGHVPEKILKEHYGEVSILAEMTEKAIPDILTKVMMEEKLVPIVLPEVSVESIDPFRFTAIVTHFPEITLEKWEDVSIPKKGSTRFERRKQKVIDDLRERFLERKPVDREAKNNDFIEINFFLEKRQMVFLSKIPKAECILSFLEKGNCFLILKKELLGMRKEEEKTFTITFPKDYGAKHLSGKPVVLR